MKTILISGGESKFAKEIIIQNSEFKIYALSKSEMDVTNLDDIIKNIKKYNPDYFIHTAALSRPMINHKIYPDVSINTNIIGTSNCVLACIKYNIKLIYISTDFVYPGIEGNYSEEDSLLPINEYAWSKLGGECALFLYDNSLIVRTAMVEVPYPHPKALTDVKKSLIQYSEAANILLRVLDERGVLNIGTYSDTIYNHVKKIDPEIEKITKSEINDVSMANDSSMNVDKLKQILDDTII